jgi:hypothetical protein
VADSSLSKDPEHVGSLASLGAVGILKHDQNAMHQAETKLRKTRTNAKEDAYIRRVLIEIAKCQGRNVDDVSRAGIMLKPSSAREWTNLSRDGDVVVQLALKLAQGDRTMDTEELSALYEKSGSIGDVRSGIFLSPWRVQGWQKLRSFQ